MLSLFKKDPLKQLKKDYEKKMERARDIQRSGDLKLYAKEIEEAEAMALKIQELSAKS